MQVTCPACSTRYTTDDAKVRGKTVRMRCRACDTVWLVKGPARSEMGAPDAEPSYRAPATYAPPPVQSYAPPASQSYAPSAVPATRPEKRGAVRERGDLFASHALDDGSVKQTLRPPPSAALGLGGLGGVGARSEESVLFTVDSLRAGARIETPAPQPWSPARTPASANDDEGIIDLNALGALAPVVSASPLGSPSEPSSGFAREVPGSYGSASHASTASRTHARGPWIAAGASAAAAALALVSAVALFGGAIPQRASRAPARIGPAATTLGNRAHDLEFARLVAAEKAASDKAAADEKREEATASKTGKTGKTGRGGGARAGTGTTTTTASVVPRPVGKSSDACGCRGDFTCILRCSSKGK
jgi:predicted Zn finger-like uncharacterized protein